MICPNCQTENRDHAKFCDQCGHPLVDLIVPAAIEESLDAIAEDAEEAAEAAEAELGEAEEAFEATIEDAIDDIIESDGLELESEPDFEIEPEFLADAENVAEDAKLADEEQIEQVDPTATMQPVEDEADELAEIERSLDFDAGAYDEDRMLIDDPMITAVIPRVKTGRDLSGLDESVYDELTERVTSDPYELPASAWHDGATMQMPRVAGEEPQKGKSYRAQGPVDKKRPKIVRIVIASIIVLALAIAGITYSMELWGGKSVPDVVGLAQADAMSVLQERGFTVRATQVKSDDTEGLVLIMDPAANSRIDPSNEVVIHVSVARYIPDIIGKTEAEAREAFTAEGFENVKFEKERSAQPEGTVLSVTPAPGESAKSASPITVKISDPFRVPDVAGMMWNDAEDAIREAGLVPYWKYYYTEDMDEGFIIGTEPPEGTILSEGDSVAILLTHSRAKEVIAATESYLVPGATIYVDGFDWEITECISIEYASGSTVSYSIVGRPYIATALGIAYFGEQTHSGAITWSEDNTVLSIY